MSLPASSILLEALPQAAALLDERGAIAVANAEFARLAGKDPESLRGTAFFDAFGFIPAVRAARDEFLAGTVPVFAEAETQHFGAVPGDYRVRLASWTEGDRRGGLVLVTEISSERRSRAAVDAYDRAAAVVSNVRHEINNSLMGMIGHLELLLAKPDVPDVIRKRAETIYQEAEKIRDRIAELSSVRKT